MPDAFDLMLQQMTDPNYAGRRFQQPNPIQPFSPEEEQSVLGKLTSNVLGGVSWVGQSLDKALGGRAIRGVLGGKPEELASLIPFSDTLGITHPENAVRGEDLLKQAGILQGEGEKGTFELRDLAGPALEIAMDPASWIGSPLTAAGKASKAAGTLEKTLAGRIGAGQSGLLGIRGFPVFGETAGVLGTGPGAQAFADTLGGIPARIAEKVPMLGRAGRYASGLFDASNSIGNRTYFQPETQAMAKAFHAGLPAAEAAAKTSGVELMKGMEAIGHTPAASDSLREMLETLGPHQPAPGGLQTIAGPMASDYQRMLAEAQAKGVPLKERALYAHRQTAPSELDVPGVFRFPQGEDVAPRHVSAEHARLESIGDIPTGIVNPMSVDEKVAGPFRLLNPKIQEFKNILMTNGMQEPEALQTVLAMAAKAPHKFQTGNFNAEADYIRNTYLGWNPVLEREYQVLRARPPVAGTPEVQRLADLQSMVDQSEQVARLLASRNPARVAAEHVMFPHDPISDYLKYTLHHNRQMLTLDVTYDTMARAATQEAAGIPGAMSLTDVLKNMRLTSKANENVLQQKQNLGHINPNATTATLNDFFLRPELAGEMIRRGSSFQLPETMRPLIQAFDSITNMVKAGLTVLGINFQTRNLAQGIYQNWAHDVRDPRFPIGHPGAYYKPYEAANTIRTGGVIDYANTIPGLTHLTPAQATAQLKNEGFIHGLLPDFGQSLSNEIIGRGSQEIAQQGFKLPSSIVQPGLDELLNPLSKEFALRKAIPTSLEEAKPWNLAGSFGRTETTFAPFKAGQEVGRTVDEMNRWSAFIALRQQGVAPEVASVMSKAMHYDFLDMTPFERNVMRRVFPFWNWTRHNIPYVLEELATNPGGKMGASIRAVGAARDDQNFMPEYIREGLGIPVGSQEGNTQRYLTYTGLPFEDLNILGVGNNLTSTLTRTGQKVLAETNPLAKAPLEVLSNKQYYSGRDLTDLSAHGLTGNPIMDQVLMASPLSKPIIMARTLADERKGIGAKIGNILGPGKITDVDMERARNVASRQYAEEVLKGNPLVRQYQNLSVPRDLATQLDPQSLEMMRLFRTVEQRQKQTAKNPLATLP